MATKKKLTAIALAATLLLSVTACGQPAPTDSAQTDGGQATDTADTGDGEKEPVVLRVWGGVPEESGPTDVSEAFNEAYADQGISVEYTRFVNDDEGNLKLETTLMSGQGVDLFITYSLATLEKRVQGNMTADLTPYIEAEGLDIGASFGPMAEAYEMDGKYYGIPTKVDYYGMMLNVDMFEAAGIPIPTEWTYSEFREIAKQLTTGEGDDKVYGAFLNTQQDILMGTGWCAYSLGGDWMYKDGNDDSQTNFEDPLVKESLQLVYDMMNVDQSVPTHTDSVTQKLSQEGMFLTGKAAMSIGPWIVRSVKDLENYPHDFQTAFAPYPVSDLADAPYQQGGAGDLLSISANSEHQEEAWEYLYWYATEGMIDMVPGGRVPLYNGYDLEAVTTDFIGDFEEYLDPVTTESILIAPRDNCAIATITTKAPEIDRIIREEVEGVLTGNITVDEGLANMQQRGDEMLQGS